MQSPQEEKNNKRHYTFNELRPKKGKFVSNVLISSVLIFLIAVIFVFDDYGLSFTLLQGLKLFGLIILMMFVVWGVAYLFRKKGREDDTVEM